MWPMLLGNSGGDSFLTGVPSKMEETGVLAESLPNAHDRAEAPLDAQLNRAIAALLLWWILRPPTATRAIIYSQMAAPRG